MIIRQEGAARSSKEIHAVSKSSVKEIKKCFHLISKVLKTSVGSITSANLISRFCATLGIYTHTIIVVLNFNQTRVY